MATLVLNPIAEEAELRKKEATAHWKAIQQSGPLVSTNSLRIGFHAAALKRDGMFGIIGFADEKEAQEASGVKQSTWFNCIRIAEAYPNVDEKLFCAMKLSNAETLMDLPESKRLTEYWMRRAATDSIDTFTSVVDAEMEDKARPSDGREKPKKKVFEMPASTVKVVEQGLKEYGAQVGVNGDESKALELMVAEHTGGPTLIGAITNAVQRIKAAKEAAVSGRSVDEILAKVLEELDAMALDFAAALDNVSNLESVQNLQAE